MALQQAIVLNGTAIPANQRAFNLGRVLAATPDRLPLSDDQPASETLAQLQDRLTVELTAHQNAGYAARFSDRILAFQAAMPALPEAETETLIRAAAQSLFRLMAYKDEYEVARLLTAPEFTSQLTADWDGGRVVYNLAPPFLPARRDARGRPVKRQFGSWLTPGLRLLARGKALRGTALDPFGWMAERREERALIGWYEALLDQLPVLIRADRLPEIRTVLEAPMQMRGYGPVKDAAIAKHRAAAEATLATFSAAPAT